MIFIALCFSCYVLQVSGFALRPSIDIVTKAPTSFSRTTIFSSENDQQYMKIGDDDSGETQSNVKSENTELQSFTRQDTAAPDMPTPNRPLLGEVAIDGSLVVLAPAVVIGVVGFICSIVIAFNSGDEFVQTSTQISGDIGVQESIQPQVSDPNVCRGICTQDQEGLENFMQSLRKSD